jgi:hypothetical protein
MLEPLNQGCLAREPLRITPTVAQHLGATSRPLGLGRAR